PVVLAADGGILLIGEALVAARTAGGDPVCAPVAHVEIVRAATCPDGVASGTRLDPVGPASRANDIVSSPGTDIVPVARAGEPVVAATQGRIDRNARLAGVEGVAALGTSVGDPFDIDEADPVPVDPDGATGDADRVGAV